MQRLLLVLGSCFLLLPASPTLAQAVVEGMAGHQNYYYQHSFVKVIDHDKSRFAFFHTTSLHAFYKTRELNELMSQSYITYRIMPSFNLAVGTFYASQPGISASLAAQVRIKQKSLMAVIVPRIDLKKNGSYEIMTSIEYMPVIHREVQLYSRLQVMSNIDRIDHNRSYQNLRAGLKINKTIAGLAMNIDERGKEKQTELNYGLFLRYQME